jgi:lipopolysaccharide/colanic/teichoic acid biosynthesis glycosyltransferase
MVDPRNRHVLSLSGNVYDRDANHELLEFTRALVRVWDRPNATIKRADRINNHVWADTEATFGRNVRAIGSVWVGAGRQIDEDTSIVGPSILWDDPTQRPAVDGLNWDDIEPSDAANLANFPRYRSASSFSVNRTFDIVFSLFALLFTLPLYPFIMLAIWLEDGRPFFFAHRRETIDGREFPCIKFRSMRKDAEKLKQDLQASNRADGPQFYIEQDPRLTRVGRVLRKLNLDELPQFANVLVGHMSVVGPRPSPRAENQFCPGWREARLSVRPGITGLWQIKRKRLAGTDFQEWIKYDLEYVDDKNLWADLSIIWVTIRWLYIDAGLRCISKWVRIVCGTQSCISRK